MKYIKKIGLGILIMMGAALCCSWCYLKSDSLHREVKMVTKLFKGD